MPALWHHGPMSTPKDRPARTPAEDRAERLAAELRANLRRRKEQARGRDAATVPVEKDENAPPR